MNGACLRVVKRVRHMAAVNLLEYRKTGLEIYLQLHRDNKEYLTGYIDAMWQIDDMGIINSRKFRRQVIKATLDMKTALQSKTIEPMSNSKPRIHVVTAKLDIDTLNKVKAEANKQGESVSAFISRAVQSTLNSEAVRTHARGEA